MAVFKCKMCGGALEISEAATTAECAYCGTLQTLPRLDNDRKANLYDRANHFRRNNEFDKAVGIYEQILSEDSNDSEAYWSLVLCKYGIEYVEDPTTRKRKPTVNRTQPVSVFADENYKAAIAHAGTLQKPVYEEEARAIDEIQKQILDISAKEKPFDVFICYKETGNDGGRTRDSVLANEMYYQLTQEGLKVFFARITLEDKLGSAYEPYIFAALNSARVMIVLGTKAEHFNAVWVKNEWSRYLALIKSGAKKTLIPAYSEMDPYDLPEEFSYLQAQDMSRLGFMQDLSRGVMKILSDSEEKKTSQAPQAAATANAPNVEAFLKRVFMFLEDGEWQSANDYCEKILDIDPENALAYLGKLMAELKVQQRAELADYATPFNESNNYRKAIRFSDEMLKAELEGYINAIIAGAKAKQDEEAARAEQQCKKMKMARKRIAAVTSMLDAGLCHTVGLRIDGTVVATKYTGNKKKYCCQCNVSDWRDIVAIAAGDEQTLGLKSDGTVVAVGKLNDGRRNALNWRNIVAISMTEEHTAGLKSDGTVVAVGDNSYGQCDVSGWKKIKAIATGLWHTVGLKSDGTVVATQFPEDYDDNDSGQCDVEAWRDIVAISAGYAHTVALKSDGTVVATGENDDCQCDVKAWQDIVAISAGDSYTVGLKSDGTVVATKHIEDDGYYGGQCDVTDWQDIVAISAGVWHTVGLKSDGTVVATKYIGDKERYFGQCDVSGFKLFNDISTLEHNLKAKQLKEQSEHEEKKLQEEELRLKAQRRVETQKQLQEKKAAEAKLRAERRSAGQCQYCGGELKGGLFGKKCVSCGNKKDY